VVVVEQEKEEARNSFNEGRERADYVPLEFEMKDRTVRTQLNNFVLLRAVGQALF